MYEKLYEQDRQLREEADELLSSRGIIKILEHYGKVYISGSYFLQLMTWRDLDIYLENDSITVEEFFELGKELVTALTPRKMSFHSNRELRIADEPKGLYWGIRAGFQNVVWKIDIWGFDKSTCLEKINLCNKIVDLLTLEKRNHILYIKNELWSHPDYRDKITSMDIYNAVLFDNVSDINGFWNYVRSKKNQ